LYNRISTPIRPSPTTTKVTYAIDHYPNFAMMLSVRIYINLDQMQRDVVEIEGNMVSLGNIRITNENTDKKKQNEELSEQASSSNSQDVKIEEMTKLIRALSNKITRLEIGNRMTSPTPQNVGQRNPQPNPGQGKPNFQFRNPNQFSM